MGRDIDADNDDDRYYVHLDNDVVIYDNGAAFNYDDDCRAFDDDYIDEHDGASDFIVEHDHYIHDDGCSHHVADIDGCAHEHGHVDDDLYICGTCRRPRFCPDHDRVDYIFDDIHQHYRSRNDNAAGTDLDVILDDLRADRFDDIDIDDDYLDRLIKRAIDLGLGGPIPD